MGPVPVSCPGGATPPPPVDDRNGDLVSGACTGALPRAHTPCTGRTRLVGRSLFNLCLARQARRPAATLCSGATSRGATEVASPRCCWSTTPPSRCRRPRSPALKGIAVSANASKLHVIFTHFDQVKGNNLPGFSDREQHVLASVENVLKSIGDELGPAAERVLRRRIDQARFFVGGIQDPFDAKKKAGSRSIQQLDVALNLLADPELAADAGPSRPVFNRMNLSLAVMEAAKTFHTRWRGILGLDYNRDAPKRRYQDELSK